MTLPILFLDRDNIDSSCMECLSNGKIGFSNNICNCCCHYEKSHININAVESHCIENANITHPNSRLCNELDPVHIQ